MSAAVTPRDVADNVARVRERIATAAARAGRSEADVTLVAAAKTKSAALVRAAVAAGVTDIGENYVQEAEEKRAGVDLEVRWHLIGHLQRNKARRAWRCFDVVQTVDNFEIAAALARHAEAAQGRLTLLIEVQLVAEPNKHGVSPEELGELAGRVRELPALSLDGLMAIPPPGSPSDARRHFRRLRALAADLGLKDLSMGMSDDFETAIEEGATMVRVGRGIFGARPAK